MEVAYIFLHPFAGSLGSTVRLRELTTHLTDYDVKSVIFTPYEKSHTLQKGVSVVSIGGILNKIGIAKYFYFLSKFAYYNPFFINHFLISQKIQKQLAKNNAALIIKALKKIPAKIIQVEQDFAIPTGIEVKKRTGLPLVADIHNLTSEELVASGAIKRNSAQFNKLQIMMKNNLAQVDEIVVVSDLMREYVITNYSVDANHVYVVPPGGTPQLISTKVSETPKVVYSGLVAHREHVDLFVKSMPLIKEKISNVEFYITNKGEDVSKIKKLSRDLNVDPVFFYYPKKEDFLAFLSSCDVAVLPSSNDLARKMGTPAKLFEYLSVGLPVVANDGGDWACIINNEKVGILAKDNPRDFADAIIKLLSNPCLRYDFSTNALNLVKDQYNWDSSSQILLQTFNKITDNNFR